MFKSRVSLLALLALAILVPTLSGCGRNTLGRVNSDKITKSEFYNRLEAVPVQTPQGAQPAGSYIMQQLITEKLILQLAQKEGVPVTDAQIQKKWDYQKKITGAEFEKSLRQQGRSQEDWKAQERINQAYVNVVTKDVSIPEADVKTAYEKALNAPNSPLKRPEQVMISAIGCVQKEKIDKAYQLLQSQDFASVAMKMSEIPGADQTQGILGWVAQSDSRVPKNVSQTAFGLETGKFCKPVQVGKQWIILKATSRRPARVLAYNDVKDVFVEQMKVRKATSTGVFVKTFQGFLKDSDISMKLDQYKSMPDMMKKNAAKQLEAINKGANGTAPTSAPGQ